MEFKFKHENPTFETIEILDGLYFAKVDTFDTGEFDYYKFVVKGDSIELLKVFVTSEEARIVRKTDEWDLPWDLQALYAKEKKGEFIDQIEFNTVYQAALAKISTM
jgi:hypothetical protein